MSEPIDYIDLTIDSPGGKSPIPRNRNAQNSSNNNLKTKLRKRNLSKRQTTSVSNIDTSTDKAHNNKEVMEIIDLDNTKSPKTICFVNDSTKENIVVVTCPICYEKLSSKMKPMSTRCGHIFCAKCLELALRTAKRCPTCQRITTKNTCNRLYF